jgi:hypothetical protein
MFGRGITAVRTAFATVGSLVHASGALAQAVEASEVDSGIRPAPTADEQFARSDRGVAGLGLTPAVATALSPAVGVRLGFRGGINDGALLTLDASRSEADRVSEWQVLGSAGWLWARDLGSARFWVGACAGGGFVMQTKPGQSTLASGVVAAGPVLGIDASLHGPFGIWAEAQLFGFLYRRDGEAVATPAPSAWLGASLAL